MLLSSFAWDVLNTWTSTKFQFTCIYSRLMSCSKRVKIQSGNNCVLNLSPPFCCWHMGCRCFVHKVVKKELHHKKSHKVGCKQHEPHPLLASYVPHLCVVLVQFLLLHVSCFFSKRRQIMLLGSCNPPLFLVNMINTKFRWNLLFSLGPLSKAWVDTQLLKGAFQKVTCMEHRITTLTCIPI